MELVLNLCWLLLLGPGAYLWLRQRRNAKPIFQSSVALACLLFLLFPVISATDDLHALRQEMEESTSTKRTQKQVSKRSAAHDFSAPPAELASPESFPPSNQVCGLVLALTAPRAASALTDESPSRGPPSLALA